MNANPNALTLKIYVSSTDKLGDQLLYEYIVFKAKVSGIAGATVIKGILSYGASSVIHSYRFWEVSDKVPVMVVLVDETDKINAFYEHIRPELENMKYGCLVTLEPTQILLQKAGNKRV